LVVSEGWVDGRAVSEEWADRWAESEGRVDGWAESEGKAGMVGWVYEAYELKNKREKLRCLLLRRKKKNMFFYIYDVITLPE
jgi:hypothetical protein